MRVPGFIGPSYVSQSTNVDAQRCVNWFPEINPLGTGKEREVACLLPAPGKRVLVTIPKSPLRGGWRASNGQLFIAAADKLYIVSSSWVATEIGTLLTDQGPVIFSDNGQQVVLVDGSFGYYWTLATETFSQITSPDFYPSTHVGFIDGYFVFIRNGT